MLGAVPHESQLSNGKSHECFREQETKSFPETNGQGQGEQGEGQDGQESAGSAACSGAPGSFVGCASDIPDVERVLEVDVEQQVQSAPGTAGKPSCQKCFQRCGTGEANSAAGEQTTQYEHHEADGGQGHPTHQMGMVGTQSGDAAELGTGSVDNTTGLSYSATHDAQGAANDSNGAHGNCTQIGQNAAASDAGADLGVRNSISNRRHLQVEAPHGVSAGKGGRDGGAMGGNKSKSNRGSAIGPPTNHRQSGHSSLSTGTPAPAGTHQQEASETVAQNNSSTDKVQGVLGANESNGGIEGPLHAALPKKGKGARTMEGRGKGNTAAPGSSSQNEAQIGGSGASVCTGSGLGGGGGSEVQPGQAKAASKAQTSGGKALKGDANKEERMMMEFLENCEAQHAGARPFLHRKKSKLPTPTQLKTLFLHAKRVPVINLSKLKSKYMATTQRQRLEELLRSLHYDRAKHAQSDPPTSEFRISEKHAKILTTDENDGKGTVLEREGNINDPGFDLSNYQVMRWFCVVEGKNSGLPDDFNDERLRGIMWALKYLQESGYKSNLRLDDTYEHRQYVHDGEYAAAFDLAASFWQVPVPKEARFVVVDDKGNVYRMTRLPYGVDCASEIMQIIVSALAGVAAFASPKHALPISQGQAKVHIDGALFVGRTKQHVANWCRQFTAACEDVGVQLNVEECNNVCTKLVFVGIEYDFVAKTVRIKPSFKVPFISRQMVAADYERIMGKLIYGGTVLALGFHNVYFAVKYYRRIANMLASGRMKRSDIVVIPPAVLKHLLTWYDAVTENQWVIVKQSPWMNDEATPHAVLITDSTLDGFGCVLLREGRDPLAFGQRWPFRQADVNDAETHAIVIGLDRFRQELDDILRDPAAGQRMKLLILVDNTSALHRVMRAERGFTLQPNQLALGVVERIHQRRIDARIEYVASPLNVADAPSRGRVIDENLVRYTLERAWGQKGVRADRHTATCVGAAANRPTR